MKEDNGKKLIRITYKKTKTDRLFPVHDFNFTYGNQNKSRFIKIPFFDFCFTKCKMKEFLFLI